MTNPLLFVHGGSDGERLLPDLGAPLDPSDLMDPSVPDSLPWEVEIGFGKGRYLVDQAQAVAAAARERGGQVERRFLGIEIATQYFRMLVRRGRKRRLGHLAAIRGEALYALATVLPREWAQVVHVYFPDPWPKAKHHKRRLFDPETVDLVLGLLAPGGRLLFATDFLEYGELVTEILEAHPAVEVRRVEGPWPDGARTNYEAKFMEEGRPILRLQVLRRPEASWRPLDLIHPDGRAGLLAAWAPKVDPAVEDAGAAEPAADPRSTP